MNSAFGSEGKNVYIWKVKVNAGLLSEISGDFIAKQISESFSGSARMFVAAMKPGLTDSG